jgi:hypothetical protein
MAKKDIKKWQELRLKLLENFFFYRDACEVDGVAVWPKNMGKFAGVSERMAEYWLKGTHIPTKQHIKKLSEYYERLKPLPELKEDSREYLKELLESAQGTLKTLKHTG